MSVINQMLKDLDQRTPEAGQIAIPLVNHHKPSTIKIILIILVVLVSLNLLGFYIWNLQEKITSSELKFKQQEQLHVAKTSSNSERQSVEKPSSDQLTFDRKLFVQTEPVPEKASMTETKLDLATELPQQSVAQEEVKVLELPSEKIVVARPQVKPKSTKTNIVRPVLVTPLLVDTPAESKMSVSRRKLTSKELVAQKIFRAEKAIKVNDIIKAEQLFEEVLIIEPNHKQARKKLAALWFGRKSYQQATNLLSQGISLDRNDAELRLLKARIHVQQGQQNAAYNTLKPLPLFKQQEYQVMLANVSQQVQQYQSAIQAYKILIEMQTYSGRWHLGLAIVYDKNSQFSLAVAEYALALTKSDLSIASAAFAQQRMQALGE